MKNFYTIHYINGIKENVLSKFDDREKEILTYMMKNNKTIFRVTYKSKDVLCRTGGVVR